MRFSFVLVCGSLACGFLAACRGEPSVSGTRPTSSQAAAEREAAEREAKEPWPTAPLAVGAKVRDARGLLHTGQRMRLSEFTKRPLLLYFCPADRSPECQALAIEIRDHWLLLNPSLSMVFGVTPEDSFTHMDFASELELSHLLVADTDNSLHKAFGLSPGVNVAYLLGPDRQVLQVFDKPQAAGFTAAVLAALRANGLERPVPPL